MSAYQRTATQRPPSSQDLQFERAESAGAAGGRGATCTACNRAISDSYFELKGRLVCPACRSRITADWNRGSSQGRFSRALGLGLLAGGIGAGIYYGVAALTGYEFGLVAIVVGLLVGGAVRKGANRRGGRAYQALAMFITYTAIVSTYIPFILKGVRESVAVQDSAAATPQQAVSVVGDSIALQANAAGQPVAAVKAPQSAAVLGIVVGVVALLVLAFAAPVLAGFQNIMGMVIIAIALYEAWKMNKRAELAVAGPYRVASSAPA